MKALSVVATEKMEITELEKPTAQKGQVVIEVAYCGICGSDLDRYFKGKVHNFPQILGHEFSGVVTEIGEGVTRLNIGDQVAVAPLIPCGECEYCAKGEPAMCTNYSFIGSRQPGAMAEYVVAPEVNCLHVPAALSLKEAAMIEPLTVAIHGVDRLAIKAGEIALVLGAGTIGLLTIAVLKARGINHIIVTDLNDVKLDMAKQCGATEIVNTSQTSLEEYFDGRSRPTIVYETAGSSVTQVEAIKYVASKGQVSFVGTSTKDVVLEPSVFERVLRGELSVTGSWMSYSAPFPGYEWHTAMDYMATGKIDVKPLITGVYQLEDKGLPFEKMVEKNSNSVKLLYKISKDL